MDPETGRIAQNQVILVEGEKIKAVGGSVAIPAGAAVIDLPDLKVLPGLVDTHTHLGLTYKDIPEHDYYYLTYVMDSTPLRAIQAASNGIQLLNSGFTVVRDLGNNALYTDTAHRVAIDQGWIPGPTMVNSGLIIEQEGRAVLADAGDGEAARHRVPRIPRGRHARRDREGRARKHAVRREDHQDLRGLQAVGLHGRRDEALRLERPRREASRSPATCRRRRGPRARSRPGSGRSSTGWRSPRSTTRQ